MKKVFLLIGVASALILGGCWPFPSTNKQTIPSTQNTQTTPKTTITEVKVAYFLKDGTMMVFQNGQYSLMSGDVTLQDGSILTTKGELKRKDGSIVKLKNNESVTVDGKLMEESMYK